MAQLVLLFFHICHSWIHDHEPWHLCVSFAYANFFSTLHVEDTFLPSHCKHHAMYGIQIYSKHKSWRVSHV